MNNSPMYYEACPDGTTQAWKVSWNGTRGGYSETVFAADHAVFTTADEAVAYAKKLEEKNAALEAAKIYHHSYENICIERCFIRKMNIINLTPHAVQVGAKSFAPIIHP